MKHVDYMNATAKDDEKESGEGLREADRTQGDSVV